MRSGRFEPATVKFDKVDNLARRWGEFKCVYKNRPTERAWTLIYRVNTFKRNFHSQVECFLARIPQKCLYLEKQASKHDKPYRILNENFTLVPKMLLFLVISSMEFRRNHPILM